MTGPETPAQLPALEALRGQISALAEGGEKKVQAGHLDLAPDLWLSCDPEGEARMRLAPAEAGLTLELKAADSGRWACLGLRLQGQQLAQARYVGVLVGLRSGDIISYRPSLRYFLPEGGMQDRATPDPVVLLPGQRETLSHIPIDPELAARAEGCELNLFFLSNSFRAEALRVEPLLML